ncbi:J domain-containing protein [Aphelenchoides besseyi]|nr:J domain-containing protein [Aphelenchoides besseyi]
MASNSNSFDDDWFSILGVGREATDSEIRDGYRKLAVKWHPDRNPGDQQALETFKRISIAYSVLADPNKRRQYDANGFEANGVDFTGAEISDLAEVGRFFGPMLHKLGIPIPTVIGPKALSQARLLCAGEASNSVDLEPGIWLTGSVANQEAHFYRVKMTEELGKHGVIIRCKAPLGSKFKLVLFDKEGGVRMIRESQKQRTDVCAEFYFVPFDRVHIDELVPIRNFNEDKETPLPFLHLEALETEASEILEARDHVLCVYGDNYCQSVTYNLIFLPFNENCSELMETLNALGPELTAKKSQMATFRDEYQENERKLKEEDKAITEKLQTQKNTWDRMFDLAFQPYSGENEKAAENLQEVKPAVYVPPVGNKKRKRKRKHQAPVGVAGMLDFARIRFANEQGQWDMKQEEDGRFTVDGEELSFEMWGEMNRTSADGVVVANVNYPRQRRMKPKMLYDYTEPSTNGDSTKKNQAKQKSKTPKEKDEGELSDSEYSSSSSSSSDSEGGARRRRKQRRLAPTNTTSNNLQDILKKAYTNRFVVAQSLSLNQKMVFLNLLRKHAASTA